MGNTPRPPVSWGSPVTALVEIYGLYDPRDGALRYIGKANNSAKRLAAHKRDAKRRDTPVYHWFRKLAASDMAPTVAVLCETDDWKAAERRLIAEHRAAGARLLNVADGGDEPYCSPVVRSANGRKLNDRNATGLKSDGSSYTNEEVVIYAYESVLKLLSRGLHQSMVGKVRLKMRERYAENPDAYPSAWQNA